MNIISILYSWQDESLLLCKQGCWLHDVCWLLLYMHVIRLVMMQHMSLLKEHNR